MYRNKAGRSWVTKAIVYSFSSALAGVVAGISLGAVGGFLALDLRLAIGNSSASARFLAALKTTADRKKPLRTSG